MNHTLRTLGATLAAGICFGTAAAQETTQQALTLQEAIELSYRQSPVLEAQRQAQEAAVLNRKSVWGLRMPQLGIGAAYTYMSKDIKAFDLNKEKEAALQAIGQMPLPFRSRAKSFRRYRDST